MAVSITQRNAADVKNDAKGIVFASNECNVCFAESYRFRRIFIFTYGVQGTEFPAEDS